MLLAAALEREPYGELEGLPENLLEGGRRVVTVQFEDDEVVVMPPSEPLNLP